MAKTTTSIRGEKVNFELMAIKNALAALPITDNVKKRERFINKKRRRSMKRKVDEMAANNKNESANFKSVTENLPTVDQSVTVEENENQDDVDNNQMTKRRKVK